MNKNEVYNRLEAIVNKMDYSIESIMTNKYAMNVVNIDTVNIWKNDMESIINSLLDSDGDLSEKADMVRMISGVKHMLDCAIYNRNISTYVMINQVKSWRLSLISVMNSLKEDNGRVNIPPITRLNDMASEMDYIVQSLYGNKEGRIRYEYLESWESTLKEVIEELRHNGV